VASAAYSWDLEAIMSARDMQLAGRFSSPVRLAESMGTDDALAVAKENRLAPAQMIGVAIEPAHDARRARSIAEEAEALFGSDGVAIQLDALTSIRSDYVDHGVAVAYCEWTPRNRGDRVDVVLRHWPLEFVWYDSVARCLMTRLDSNVGGQWCAPIVHGDGTWVVFSKQSTLPWRHQAAILPGCMVWARHAFAARDWAKGSASHGNAKVVGELPESVSLKAKDADGNIVTSAEAEEFAALLVDIASLDTPVGIKPNGATIDYLTNSSKAWEVWERLMSNAERSAARIYLGTDGTLGAQGGAPGVDVQALFGVARTRVESDLECERRAIQTGVIEPWCAVNFGDSEMTPRIKHLLPDPDRAGKVEEVAASRKKLTETIKDMKDLQLVVDQDTVDRIAAEYGISPPPTLASIDEQTSALVLAPTDVAKVVTVKEARSAQGLPPFGDDRDNMTIDELSQRAANSEEVFDADNVPAPAGLGATLDDPQPDESADPIQDTA